MPDRNGCASLSVLCRKPQQLVWRARRRSSGAALQHDAARVPWNWPLPTLFPVLRYQQPIKRAAFYTLYPIGAYEIGLMNNLATVSTVDYRKIFCASAQRIEEAYSLNVNIGPVTGSYTGQFDGKEIWVDLDRDPEEAVFILVHLFGHTVQWNLDEKLRQLGLAVSGVKEQDLPRIYQ